MANKRSPTETLMAALEEFGVDEPENVYVLFTTKDNNFVHMSSTDCYSTRLGLLESAKIHVTQSLLKVAENEP